MRVINKMPENHFYLGLIACLVPPGRCHPLPARLRRRGPVVLDRQFPRGAVGSPFRPHRHSLRRVPAAHGTLAHRPCRPRWRSTRWPTKTWSNDLEGAARRLVAAIGLEWNPACLEFHRARRPVLTASRNQVRRPIYRTSVGRWQHYQHELSGLFARVDDQARTLGDRRIAV